MQAAAFRLLSPARHPLGDSAHDEAARRCDGGRRRRADERGPIVEEKRGKLRIAWRETRWIEEGRDACTRTCLAHKADVQILLTFNFWLDDINRFSPAWDEIVRTLRLAEYVRRPDR